MPNNPMPKVGDNVRVVLEGAARMVSHMDGGARGRSMFNIGQTGQSNTIYLDAEHVKSVEVLPPPEREWKAGDIVTHEDYVGRVWVYNGTGWWHQPGFSEGTATEDMAHPLTLLYARDGSHLKES